jgi:hypothetical protein
LTLATFEILKLQRMLLSSCGQWLIIVYSQWTNWLKGFPLSSYQIFVRFVGKTVNQYNTCPIYVITLDMLAHMSRLHYLRIHLHQPLLLHNIFWCHIRTKLEFQFWRHQLLYWTLDIKSLKIYYIFSTFYINFIFMREGSRPLLVHFLVPSLTPCMIMKKFRNNWRQLLSSFYIPRDFTWKKILVHNSSGTEQYRVNIVPSLLNPRRYTFYIFTFLWLKIMYSMIMFSNPFKWIWGLSLSSSQKKKILLISWTN